MDSMGSMDMGGMDSSSAGVFKPTNMYIARVYWYIVAAFVALLGLIRLFNASSNLWMYVPIEYRRSATTSLTSI